MAPKIFAQLLVQFIGENVWDRRITDLRKQYQPKPAIAQAPCRKVKIQSISKNSSHPAAGQHGLFAAQTLHPGEHILDYLGYVTTEEFAEESQYVAQLAPNILVDASKMGSEARCGVSVKPLQ